MNTIKVLFAQSTKDSLHRLGKNIKVRKMRWENRWEGWSNSWIKRWKTLKSSRMNFKCCQLKCKMKSQSSSAKMSEIVNKSISSLPTKSIWKTLTDSWRGNLISIARNLNFLRGLREDWKERIQSSRRTSENSLNLQASLRKLLRNEHLNS